MGKEVKILTDIKARVSTVWKEKTDFWPELKGGRGIFSDFIAALRLLYFSKRYDITVVASNRSGNIFAMISALWPGTKRPILMVDCLWYSPRNKLLLWIKRLQIRLMARAVNQFVVWTSHEVRDYAAAFSIPEAKFLYVPFHQTLEGYCYEVTSGDYVFSGGDSDRDYATLLEAVRDLGIRVIIATKRKDWNRNISIPPNVQAFPVTHDDFRKWMAGSKIVVMPMQKGLLRSGGQQTYLNAMAMGKPVIVADDEGAKDYIQNGVDGLIVPSGDVEALRIAIKSVLDDPRFAERLANSAKKAYDTFSTPKCMEKILQTAEQIVFGKSF